MTLRDGVAPSLHVPPEDPPESPFSPPYRSDACIEHRLVPLPSHTRMQLEAAAQSMHQSALLRLVKQVHACPEPLPPLLAPNCLPGTELQKSERVHAVIQLLCQIRELQHQSQLKKAYKAYGNDHRTAAKELYARSQFTIAYIHYWTLFSCLSCDTCRLLPPAERHNLAVDLLEKLAVTCLRAGWLSDAANFAKEALSREEQSTRARIWLATAHLGLGSLDAARKELSLLPRRGHFPSAFPSWIEARVVAQREVLARLEQEQRGVFNVLAMEEDATDRVPVTPHSTATFQIEATPAGWRTIARVAKDALLLVAAPLACAPCYTAEPQRIAEEEEEEEEEEAAIDADVAPANTTTTTTRTAATTRSPGSGPQTRLPPILHTPHDDASDPTSLFSLALVADSVFEQAKAHAHGDGHDNSNGHGHNPLNTSSHTDLTAAASAFLSTPPPPAPLSAHEQDPPVLTLAELADEVYTQAKVGPVVRVSVRGAAARVVAARARTKARERERERARAGDDPEGEALLEIVGNELRAASILVAQNYTVSIPHPHSHSHTHTHATTGRTRRTGSRLAPNSSPLDRPAHAGHAIYVPALKLVPCATPAEGNTYPTFHGPYLFLRAMTDLRAGTILSFGGFSGAASAAAVRSPLSARARGGAPVGLDTRAAGPGPGTGPGAQAGSQDRLGGPALRARVTALASSSPVSSPVSKGSSSLLASPVDRLRLKGAGSRTTLTSPVSLSPMGSKVSVSTESKASTPTGTTTTARSSPVPATTSGSNSRSTTTTTTIASNSNSNSILNLNFNNNSGTRLTSNSNSNSNVSSSGNASRGHGAPVLSLSL